MKKTEELVNLITPCLDWCLPKITGKSDASEIVESLRSPTLRDIASSVFPDSCHTPSDSSVIRRFSSYIAVRNNSILLEPVENTKVEFVLSGMDKLLVTDWTMSLFDGVASVETEGFINDDGMSAWDTWVGILPPTEVNAPSDSGYVLLSWVPDPLVNLVDAAISADASSSLSWLHLSQ